MYEIPTIENSIIQGDCLNVMAGIPSNSIDFIITSPPYADQRKQTYGGIHPDKYVEWFLPISKEIKRILKPRGSFILNIKEKVVGGERHTYVLELIIAMRKQGWLWTEEYMWHKKNSYPGKWPNRFRDSWERCLHFTKDKHFVMYQDAVMVPIGDWASTRLKNPSKRDYERTECGTESGFGMCRANWAERDVVYPDNVIYLSTECGNKKHSAAFPVELPSWFIKLFSAENDIVLDPFMGSGTTAEACLMLKRKYIGIEMPEKNIEVANDRINNFGVGRTADSAI